jgi:hypothetical protein
VESTLSLPAHDQPPAQVQPPDSEQIVENIRGNVLDLEWVV